ncbi:hypothetical protein CUJ84_Chr001996 [Rhizobium leguminosarum]|uniref:Uncharacterized protein n=1 Tax=Rhizobium leguminosarum TaxID=384 RepID=A0A2K9Z295_RHILE|nr:hypothetical protein CUJ84_Chr001996 [Rhizobium leguminosarum]
MRINYAAIQSAAASFAAPEKTRGAVDKQSLTKVKLRPKSAL